MRRRRAPAAVLALLAGGLLALTVDAGAASAAPGLPPIHHVFVIVLENESAATTFGAGSPAPYLANTLTAQGAYLPNYYGVAHNSNGTYIAMISGQAPSVENQADCLLFNDLVPGTIGPYGQAQGLGCVYPAAVPTIAGQLISAGLTWRDYNDGMGADPRREPAECAHPGVGSIDNTQSASATDQYATRHNPFVYFHSIIDDTTLCDTHVVNLDLLPRDLASAPNTPNYVVITPNLCNDGHDATCASGGAGGLARADAFLRKWVPLITSSPAFRGENGLLIITSDEAATSDTSSCCGEIAGPNSPLPGILGPGGGDVGAVLLSPCIAPGTVTQQPYNHYTMLRSVEDLFGLAHIGYAQLPGETSFGPDVFTRPCPLIAPLTRIRSPGLALSSRRFTVHWAAQDPGGSGIAGFTVQVRETSSQPWRTVPGYAATGVTSLAYPGRPGHSYDFRVRATDNAGVASSWATSPVTVVPTGVSVSGGRYSGAWRVRTTRGAWEGRAILSSTPGASFMVSYLGGDLAILGALSPAGGRARVTLDGRRQVIDLHSGRPRPLAIIYRARLRPGRHRLSVSVLSGTVALEGFAIRSGF